MVKLDENSDITMNDDFKKIFQELTHMSSVELGRLIASSESVQEQKFFSMIVNYILQARQSDAIANNRY